MGTHWLSSSSRDRSFLSFHHMLAVEFHFFSCDRGQREGQKKASPITRKWNEVPASLHEVNSHRLHISQQKKTNDNTIISWGWSCYRLLLGHCAGGCLVKNRWSISGLIISWQMFAHDKIKKNMWANVKRIIFRRLMTTCWRPACWWIFFSYVCWLGLQDLSLWKPTDEKKFITEAVLIIFS